MVTKFVAYYLTNSSVVLADALESIINVVAASFAFYSVRLSSLPRDKNHPYGHGKIEFFSAGLEGVLIILASFYLIFHAVHYFFSNKIIQHIDYGLYAVLLGVFFNWLLGNYMYDFGKKNSSPLLIADGMHLKIDAYSGLILVISLIVTYYTNYTWVDSVATSMFALYMFWEGVKILRKSIGGLMDETDKVLLKKMADILNKNRLDSWIDIHNLRIQQYGGELHLDCHLTLPNYWNLEKVHDVVHDFEVMINSQSNTFVEVFIHSDPCLPSCCNYCRIKDCPIRTSEYTKLIDWNSTNLSTNQKHFSLYE